MFDKRKKAQPNTNTIGLVFNMNKSHEYETYHAILQLAQESGIPPATCVKMCLRKYFTGQSQNIKPKTKKDDVFDDFGDFELGF